MFSEKCIDTNKKMDMLMNLYRDQWSPKINIILEILQAESTINDTNALDTLPPFPFRNSASFILFDEKLSDPVVCKQFVCKLKY